MNLNDMDLEAPGTPAATPAAPSSASNGAGQPKSATDLAAGTISAEVTASKLDVSMLVGQSDLIEGKIKTGPGKSLVVRGTIDGAIECDGTVVILKGGKVLGHIKAGSLVTEGDIGDSKKPATIDVGELVLGVNSRVVGDCTYDTMAVAVPNRGIRGQMIPRSESEGADS